MLKPMTVYFKMLSRLMAKTMTIDKDGKKKIDICFGDIGQAIRDYRQAGYRVYKIR